ncbi:outer membrane receptor for Fe3+-dicitrate [Desulfobaculum xiamenense]|uniref:Outer membrane receptor for Fe3+-dicitrate n=1 Tax=Desulfobaculum xiamenense TaxID=995050 RepID=A0A846QHS9_9BACT|nr:TonB-dependent receptor plug domain-containing protein [Desulfobaculum xiamenense]NJB66670.1 outer membrane receptor for Fe3+-dicitrate [Desulfobaculum xiamenense]
MNKTKKKQDKARWKRRKALRAALAALALALCIGVGPALAQDESAKTSEQDERVMVLDKVSVQARHDEPGKATITRERLEHLPSATGSITETLRTQPNVQFDEGFGTSLNGGEITPPDISISGGKAYENNFTIDGLGNNNRIDPSGFDNGEPTAFPSGAPQSIFLDTELVDEVEVYTSNIPAKHGLFTGGVVNAKTRTPADEFGGKVKIRHSRDKWSNQRPADNEDFEDSSSASSQPLFSRYDGSVTLDIPITDSTGAIVAYSAQHATIPLHYMDGEKDQIRLNQNLFGKLVHELDDRTSIDLTMVYAPYTAENFTASAKNSGFDIHAGGYDVKLGFTREMDLGTLEMRTAYSESQTHRDAEENIHTTWTKSGASTQWGTNSKFAMEGGFGDAKTEQRSLATMVDFTTAAAQFGPTSHVFNMGLSHENVFGSYEQSDDQIAFYNPTTSTTVVDNGQGGVIAGEQYARAKSVRAATSRSANMNLLAAYLDDTITLGRLTLTPGLRVSYDDLTQNTNLEPRFRTTFDILGDGQLKLIGGANRYYGAPLLSYALRSVEPLVRYSRSIDGAGNLGDWQRTTSSGNNGYDLSGLDTPYSDEISIGAEAQVFGGVASIEYLQREGRDQFGTKTVKNGKDTFYTLTNDGRTDYEGYTLKFEKTVDGHFFSLGATYADQSSNFSSFIDSSNNDWLPGYNFDKVYYEGELIDRADMPRSNFNRPWVVTFVYSGKVLDRLTFTNTTRYVSNTEAIVKKGKYTDTDGVNYYKYEKSHLDDNVTFDWQLDYEAWRHENQLLTLNLTVKNVFDSTGIVDSEGNRQIGRQFWAGATYEF